MNVDACSPNEPGATFDRAHAELSVELFVTNPLVVVRSKVPGRRRADRVCVSKLPAGREMSWSQDFDMWRERVLPGGATGDPRDRAPAAAVPRAARHLVGHAPVRR